MTAKAHAGGGGDGGWERSAHAFAVTTEPRSLPLVVLFVDAKVYSYLACHVSLCDGTIFECICCLMYFVIERVLISVVLDERGQT